MFWAYNLKHFFKLNIKIDAGENIHKSGEKNMLHDNKDRMIQILVYGTVINKTFWVKIFGNYNAQHEHSQQKLLPGQKKKKKSKKRKKERNRTLLSFFLIWFFYLLRHELHWFPEIDFVALLSDDLIKLFLLIKSTFFVLIMRSKYLVFQN